MSLSELPTATIAELAWVGSEINQIGANRSRPLQTAQCVVNGMVYVSNQHRSTWVAGSTRKVLLPKGSMGPLTVTPDQSPVRGTWDDSGTWISSAYLQEEQEL